MTFIALDSLNVNAIFPRQIKLKVYTIPTSLVTNQARRVTISVHLTFFILRLKQIIYGIPNRQILLYSNVCTYKSVIHIYRMNKCSQGEGPCWFLKGEVETSCKSLHSIANKFLRFNIASPIHLNPAFSITDILLIFDMTIFFRIELSMLSMHSRIKFLSFQIVSRVTFFDFLERSYANPDYNSTCDQF